MDMANGKFDICANLDTSICIYKHTSIHIYMYLRSYYLMITPCILESYTHLSAWCKVDLIGWKSHMWCTDKHTYISLCAFQLQIHCQWNLHVHGNGYWEAWHLWKLGLCLYACTHAYACLYTYLSSYYPMITPSIWGEFYWTHCSNSLSLYILKARWSKELLIHVSIQIFLHAAWWARWQLEQQFINQD
jgi:hypothetical protein